MKRALIFIILVTAAIPAFATERAVEGEVIVDAPVADVWKAWTTNEVSKWFGADSNIELRVGGPYEIYFDQKTKIGCNGCMILAFQPERLLSFTWNAPPHLPEARAQFTHVTVRLEPVGENQTRVKFREDGWGDGGQWDEAYTYFQRAWLEFVLPNLKKHFAKAGGAGGGAR